jgi:hypothetical protein
MDHATKTHAIKYENALDDINDMPDPTMISSAKYDQSSNPVSWLQGAFPQIRGQILEKKKSQKTIFREWSSRGQEGTKGDPKTERKVFLLSFPEDPRCRISFG